MTSVVIPWRDSGDPHRAAALAWVLGWWQRTHPDWPVVVGECQDGPWVKATAVADGISRCPDGVVVIADADVWCQGVAAAVEAVEAGRRWAIPHQDVYRLDEDATAVVLAGGQPDPARLAQAPYGGMPGGGLMVITTRLWRRCPMDPRFEGWGQEDQAWGAALWTLHGPPWRGTAPLWHLWHEEPPRRNRRVGSLDGARLAERYEQAQTSPTAMAAVIGEIEGVEDMSNQGDMDMWVYKNRNEPSQIVKVPIENKRLSNLPNWEILQRPWYEQDPPAPPVPVEPPVIDGPVVEMPPTAEDMAAAEAEGGLIPPAPDGDGLIRAHLSPGMVVVPDRVAGRVGRDVLAKMAGEDAEAITASEALAELSCEDVPKPTARDDKAAWERYAAARGVDPSGKTKAQLIAACKG